MSTLGATGGRGNKKGTPNSAEGFKSGEARNIVAKNVGFRSGHEVDRAIKTIDKIESLKEEGRVEDAELLRGALNNSRSRNTREQFKIRLEE